MICILRFVIHLCSDLKTYIQQCFETPENENVLARYEIICQEEC